MSAPVMTAAEQYEALDCPTLNEVLSLAAAGYRVFPLAPNSKEVVLGANWKRIATSDPEKVRSLWVCNFTGWKQPYNVGVAPDAGVLVVDVDVRDEKRGDEALAELERTYGQLPQTYTVRTPSGGFHYYFRSPPDAGPFKSKLAADVDLKTLNGYVVGEGSTIDGKRYTRAAGEPGSLTDAPEWLVDLARHPPDTRKTVATSIDADDLDSPSALARAIDYLANAPDHGTYKVACAVKDYGISLDKCWELLCEHWDEARELGKGPEHIRVKVDNAYRYGQSPVGVKSAEMEFDAVEVADRRAKPFDAEQPTDKGLLERIAAATRLPSYFKDKPIPEVDWLVPNFILDREVTLFSGHGGTGKSTVALQLGVALATGLPWLGVPVAGVKRLLYLSAEDGERRIHRRLASILAHSELTWDDLHDRLAIMPWRNPVIGAPGRNIMEPTPFARALEAYIAERDFDVIVLDNLADIFAGNEVDRVQVTQFIGILNGLVDRRDLAILMLGHPSVRGRESGTGESGSTGWHNKVRSRLYLSDSDEKRDGTRKLESLKQQDSAAGEAISVRWSNGAFAPTRGYAPEDIAAEQLSAEARFLEVLDAWTNEGRFVNESPGSNYAPKRFGEDPRVGPVTKKELTDAMNRLFAKGEIRVEEYTNPHRDRRKRLVRSDGGEKS